MDRIVLCAAMPMETRALCKRLGTAPLAPKRTVVHTVSPYGGAQLTLIASGVGRTRMQAQLESLGSDPVSYWLSFGAAGALHDEIEVGTCYQGGSVITNDGNTVGFTVNQSHFLYCSNTPLLTPESKRDVRQRLNADLVDMESAAVAIHAKARGERFAWIKAISDGADEVVSEEAIRCIGQDGFPNIGASLKVIASRPWGLPLLIQMGMRASRLDAVLADAVLEWIKKVEFENTTCESE